MTINSELLSITYINQYGVELLKDGTITREQMTALAARAGSAEKLVEMVADRAPAEKAQMAEDRRQAGRPDADLIHDGDAIKAAICNLCR